MTTLYELIRQYSWFQVWERMLELYPDEDNNEEGYEEAWEELLMTPTSDEADDLRISVTYVEDDSTFDDDTGEEIHYKKHPDDCYYSVCGYKLHTPEELEAEREWLGIDPEQYPDGYDMPYGIEFSKWSHWLTWPISEDTLDQFSELDILVHCLWEMTFCGYTQEDVDEEKDELSDAIESIDPEAGKTFSSVAEMYEDITGEEWDPGEYEFRTADGVFPSKKAFLEHYRKNNPGH